MKIKFLIMSILLMGVAQARTVTLGDKTKRICLKKSESIISKAKQFDVLAVNGKSSRKSTFYYKGKHSNLILDFHRTKHVIAKCKSVGSDKYKFIFSIAGDNTLYNQTIKVNCVPCFKPISFERPTTFNPREIDLEISENYDLYNLDEI